MVYLDLLKGDCLDVMKDISSNTIDCFLCDLPYGCLSRSSIGELAEKKKFFSGASEGCAWDIKIDLKQFWEQVKRLAKNDHTPVLMFCTTKFGNELINSNPSWFRYDLVWDKLRGVSFLTANKMPMRSHEMIYVFSKAGAFYNRIDEKGKPYETKQNIQANTYGTYKPVATVNTGTRCVKSVIEIGREAKHNQHPTQKPSELYRWLVERYSPEGGTVLDPTAGSFTSCFTAFEMNRNAIGIEKDENFYKKACEVADTL